MGRSLEIYAHFDLDTIGEFDVLRFGVERFGADPAFPDDSHELSEAGLGVLMYRIQQANRMHFSAPAEEEARRLRSKPSHQLYERAHFGIATAVGGKPDRYLAHLIFENVLVESVEIARPIPYVPAIAVVAIMADRTLIGYARRIGAPHEM
jgi:hypothetical protein